MCVCFGCSLESRNIVPDMRRFPHSACFYNSSAEMVLIHGRPAVIVLNCPEFLPNGVKRVPESFLLQARVLQSLRENSQTDGISSVLNKIRLNCDLSPDTCKNE